MDADATGPFGRLSQWIRIERGDVSSRIDGRLRDTFASASSPMQALLSPVLGTQAKRLRPHLLLASASFGEADVRGLLDVAVAIELVHSASLIHDDLMDRAQMRRGVPTLWRKHGTTTAALAGGFLFQTACTLTQRLTLDDESTAALVRHKLAKAADETWRGQWREFTRDTTGAATVEDYLHIVELKTARLFEVSCEVGGLLAGTFSEGLAAYGKAFGVLYQMADDLRDIFCTQEELGKPPGSDIREGVATLPIIVHLSSKFPETPTVDHLFPKPKGRAMSAFEAEELRRDIAEGTNARTCLDYCHAFATDARRHLADMPNISATQMLAELVSDVMRYLEWLVLRGRNTGCVNVI